MFPVPVIALGATLGTATALFALCGIFFMCNCMRMRKGLLDLDQGGGSEAAKTSVLQSAHQFSIERTTEPIQPRALLKFPNVYSPKLAMTSPEIINYTDLTQNAPEEPAAPVDQYSPEGSSRKTHGSGESCVLRQTDLPEDIRSTENLEPDKLASRNQAPKLRFSLGYDCEKAELCVASLEAVSGSIEGDEEALSDCYIHGSLTTGSSKAEAHTALMKKMPHAIWEEALLFPLAALETPEGMLTLTLKNCDRFSRHHIAGEIKLSLENVGAPLGVARWVDLKTPGKDLPEAETNTASGGEVLLSISYLPAASRLIVVLIKARDLPSSGLDDLLGKGECPEYHTESLGHWELQIRGGMGTGFRKDPHL